MRELRGLQRPARRPIHLEVLVAKPYCSTLRSTRSHQNRRLVEPDSLPPFLAKL